MLLILKIKEGSQGMKAAPLKRQGMKPSHFAFKALCWISDIRNEKVNIFLVLSHEVVVVCFSSHRKLIHFMYLHSYNNI